MGGRGCRGGTIPRRAITEGIHYRDETPTRCRVEGREHPARIHGHALEVTGGEMRTFTIHRSQWYRGNRYESKLKRREDGKMCCLGCIATEAGVSENFILGK